MKAIIDKYSNMPFHYNGADCCAFVGECVETVIGYNPSEQFSRWNKTTAYAHLARNGGLRGILRQMFGRPHFGYEEGDVALVRLNDEHVAGVFYRNRIVCRTQTGIVDLPPWRAEEIYRCRN